MLRVNHNQLKMHQPPQLLLAKHLLPCPVVSPAVCEGRFTHIGCTIIGDGVESIDSTSGRRYKVPSGELYPSITTVLSYGDKAWLEEWRQSYGVEAAAIETQRCADRGTAVHLMAERYLNNHPNPTEDQSEKHAMSFRQLKMGLNRVSNIHTQESALWSDTLRIAGRVDCIGEFDGKLSIIDFKTSTRDKSAAKIQDYYLQTAAYALMYEELCGIRIDQTVILMAVENGAVPLVFTQPVGIYIKPLVERVLAFHRNNK